MSKPVDKITDTDRYNASYFGIPVDRMPEHNALMGMSMAMWPDSLKAHCKAVSDRIGWCGDVAACAVADWLKTQPKGTTLYEKFK